MMLEMSDVILDSEAAHSPCDFEDRESQQADVIEDLHAASEASIEKIQDLQRAIAKAQGDIHSVGTDITSYDFENRKYCFYRNVNINVCKRILHFLGNGFGKVAIVFTHKNLGCQFAIVSICNLHFAI